jgi:CIC family chloride channel protein
VKWFHHLRKSVDWRLSGKWTALCILVGVISAAGAWLFQISIQLVVAGSLHPITGWAPGEAAGEASSFEHSTSAISPWLIVPVMIGGALIAGFLVSRYAPEAEGHGTDAAIEAFHFKRGVIRARIPFIKTVASAITIGTGGSGGREGPIAQIGAGFGSNLATVLGLSARDRRILLASGVGAGIGAIFRAPLAGALFAAEILYSEADLESEVIVSAATSSIIAYSLFSLTLPESIRHLPLFGAGLNYQFSTPLELLPYGLMALILAGSGALYIKTFYGVHSLFSRSPFPKWLRPGIGAALAGFCAMALYYGFQGDTRTLAVLSSGYGTLQQALTNAPKVGVSILLAVAVIKVLTTSLTISSGGSGGVFGPSMVIGGCLGTAIGLLFQKIWPALIPHPESFGIVGMAGFFSGCAHAPFSTIIMVSELTGGYGLLLPTMWVSTLCFLLGKRWKLYQKQVPSRLESPAHRGDFQVDVLEGIRVAEVLDPSHMPRAVPESTRLEDILRIVAETQQHYFPVVDQGNRLVGIFSGDDVRSYMFNSTLWQLAVASDVMHAEVVAVTPDDDLNTALRKFTRSAVDELPVVAVADRTKLLGTIRHQDVAKAYHRKLLEYEQFRLADSRP